MAADPNWESFSIQLPGQDLLEGARNALETLVVFLEVIKTILETVKVFLVDFGNPLKALLEALIQRILQLFEALRRTGVYGWFDIPNPLVDPNFNRFVGGFPAFTTRFKAGLVDNRDPNRPQPIPGVTDSGFILIVADAEGIPALIRLISALVNFFGKSFLKPQYLAPGNFKVLPLGSDGDPVLSIVKLFQDQPKSVVVEWSTPTSTVPGDPGFSDLFGALATDFIPPRFLIEKSEKCPLVEEVDISNLGDADAAGKVVATLPTKFEYRGKPNQIISRKVHLTDSYYDPFLKFQKYIVVDALTILLGQLGTFRYIDNDVELNKTYYYRVRAYSGSLDISGTVINFKPPKTDVVNSTPFMEWPGSDPASPPVMGRATPVTAIRVPTYPSDFDVIEVLQRLFQTAFSLNFHLPLPEGATFNSTTGEAIEPTEKSDIGKQTLTSLAGPLTSFEAVPLVGGTLAGVSKVTLAFQPDAVTGKWPELPWNNPLVRRNSSRLSTIVASAMLEANNALAFKTFMEQPFPKGNPDVEGLTATNIEDLVYEITKVQDPILAGRGGVQNAGVLYGNAFTDTKLRLNVKAAVEYCKTFTLGGTPPDWIQISILRDIIPWSGQLLYELLAKMQALLDAYQGVIDELKAFIDLIIRKIDTLESFLAYLISILDFVLSLSLGFYILNVPDAGGDVNNWMSLIDNAGGSPPPSGPGGYTGGIGLGYVALDIGPFKEAFSLIF